jgi:hypothetical protein
MCTRPQRVPVCFVTRCGRARYASRRARGSPRDARLVTPSAEARKSRTIVAVPGSRTSRETPSVSYYGEQVRVQEVDLLAEGSSMASRFSTVCAPRDMRLRPGDEGSPTTLVVDAEDYRSPRCRRGGAMNHRASVAAGEMDTQSPENVHRGSGAARHGRGVRSRSRPGQADASS